MDGIATSTGDSGKMDAGMLSRIQGILSGPGENDETPPDEAAVDPTAAVEETVDAAAVAPAEEPPAPPAPELSAGEKAKLARALLDNERLQADALRLKRQLDDGESILGLVSKIKAGDKAAAFELLKQAGTGFDELGEGLLSKKIAAPEAEDPVAKRQRELDERLAAIEAKEKAAEAKEIFDQEIEAINANFSEDSPIKALSWAAKEVHRRFYAKYEKTGTAPKLADVIAELESTYENDVKTAANPRLLKSVLTDRSKVDALLADPEIKKMFAEALGVSAEKTRPPQQVKTGLVPKGGPSALTRSAASEVPVRKPDAKPTDEELRANAIRAFNSGGSQ